jgi:ABC-2 type transport system permease protein
MMRKWRNIYHLGVKELYSLRRDTVLMVMIIWAFSLSIYVAATSISHDLNHATLGIVDEDRSQLSGAIRNAFLLPHFQEPHLITLAEIDPGMDRRLYTFTLVIPPDFERDVLAGNRPALQVNIDATAMMQAGIGAGYIRNILQQEVAFFLGQEDEAAVGLEMRYAFNPNLEASWFSGIMEMINNVTMLSILLTGAALIREREHGTIEHLLVMPLTPFEIVMAKVWANGLIVLLAVAFSLIVVVQGMLDVPVAGSRLLFLCGTALYLFFAAALGIFMGTIAGSMPQFGLLFILIALPMNLLSGGQTPLESQPVALQYLMQLVPSTHFVSFAQGILYRGAGLEVVWPQFTMVALVGGVFFMLAVARFRRSISSRKG